MFKFALVAVSLIPLALANGYGHEESYGHGGGQGGSHGEHGGYEKHYEPHYPPQPYKFGYDVKDGYGGNLNQKEEGDSYGNKKGSYGYTDAYGIYRTVDYIADKNGFRATVRTNEPGTANQNPADVYMNSNAAPSHYEGNHKYESNKYEGNQKYSASYSVPAKIVAPVYKAAPVIYAAPKAIYKGSMYGSASKAYMGPVRYALPNYADEYY